ncbi:MAG: RNA polymerase sigma factor [Phycisphaerales bacterium]
MAEPTPPTSHTPANPAREPADPAAARDLQLVRAIRAGDPAAWSTLLARHQDRLFATCLRMVGKQDLATDLCQEAMVRIIQGLPTFDGSAALTTWMTRVTMNVVLTHLRAAKLRAHASLEGLAERAPNRAEPTSRTSPSGHTPGSESELSPESRVQQVEMHEHLARALATIDPESRAMLVLRDVRGLEYAQIAQALGIAEGTVKSRLFRARAALRDLLSTHETGSHDRTSSPTRTNPPAP